MIELIVFDMAGTTVDEQQIVYKCLYRSLYQSGFDLTYDQVLLWGAGKEKKQAIRDILLHLTGEVDPVIIDAIYQDFKEQLLFQYHHHDIRPQPGAEETFSRLQDKGIFVALNTGYDRPTAELLLDRLGWKAGIQIDFLITAGEVPNGRPAPDMIQKLMHRFNITDAHRVMKVGDAVADIEEGLAAGCRFVIGVTTGACTREELLVAGATHVIDSLTEIFTLLETNATIAR